jgi:hypothetical protein
MQVFNGNSWTNMIGRAASIYLRVGDVYQGGKVAYILVSGDPGYDANTQHGLVATATDVSVGAEWGCFSFSAGLNGADGIAIGTGNQNTIDIMAGCGTAGIAARLCGDLVLGGYSDWYLPSKDELNKLYLNRVDIGGFTSNHYWTSSEIDGFYANYQDFANGQFTFGDRRNTKYVRAIRAF